MTMKQLTFLPKKERKEKQLTFENFESAIHRES